MQTQYVAYGIELRCDFKLPGVVGPSVEHPGMVGGSVERLPSLRLTLRTPAELASAWSAECRAPAWSGRLSDGVRLTVERGKAGDVLFSYGYRARFRLDSSHEQLECAPADVADTAWQRALVGSVLCKVSVMLGYEALHAAVVDSPRGVVAFLGPSRAGKSTLALELVRRGWPLFADDALIFARGELGVLAHSGGAHLRVAGTPPSWCAGSELGSAPAGLTGKRWLIVGGASDGPCEPRPIRALCLLARGRDLTLSVRTLPSNPLLLAPFMLGFQGNVERQRRRFAVYGELVAGASLMRLTGALSDRPSQLVDAIERALAPRPAFAASAA
jgi:hypothetical protein